MIFELKKAGVTSWGIGCASAENPGEWAKVSNYIDWISDELDQSINTKPIEESETEVEIKPVESKPETEAGDQAANDVTFTKPEQNQIRYH